MYAHLTEGMDREGIEGLDAELSCPLGTTPQNTPEAKRARAKALRNARG